MQLIWFVMGAVMGSAANALIDRLPRRESWTIGRSKCDKCRQSLGWRDLMPILSFVSLGGKCRYCRSPIPRRNLVVEIFMGLAFVGVVQLHPSTSSGQAVAQLILMGMVWVTTIIAVMDWETRLVSEVMAGVWGLLVLAYQFTIHNLQFTNNFQSNLIGLVVGVGVIGGVWAISRGKAMGFGDVEIAAVMGLLLGWPRVAVGLWAAFVTGAMVGVWQMAGGKKKLTSQIAFGPFLILGTWLAYGFGKIIWTWVFPF